MLYILKDATISDMELIVLSFLDVFAWSAVVSEDFAALVAYGWLWSRLQAAFFLSF